MHRILSTHLIKCFFKEMEKQLSPEAAKLMDSIKKALITKVEAYMAHRRWQKE